MNSLRLSGSPCDTCSAEMMVPCTTRISTPAASSTGVSSRARCGLTRAATVTPASRTDRSASVSSAVSSGAACSSCNSRTAAVGSSSSAAARTRASAPSGSACRAHSPSAFSTASPPSRPIATALVGDTTASVGCVTSGISNRYASSCQAVETSLELRVRREGTISTWDRS